MPTTGDGNRQPPVSPGSRPNGADEQQAGWPVRERGSAPAPPRLALFLSELTEPTVYGISGAVAGLVSAVFTCPLDVIKTRLQNQRISSRAGQQVPVRYRGMVQTASTIIKHEGLRGLYRGIGPMTLGYVPTWAVYMAVYDLSREHFYSITDKKSMARIYASMVAGASATVATNPIWVIKTRFMAQSRREAWQAQRQPAVNPPYYRSTAEAARSIYQKEGIRAFYSGLTPALLGLSHVAIQFPLYEYLKSKFTGLEMGESGANPEGGAGRMRKMKQFGAITAATVLSKMCASAVTYPHEVVRTRLQTEMRKATGPSGGVGGQRAGWGRLLRGDAARMVRTIWLEEGWAAFYSGMGTNLVRAVPAALSMMLTFEACRMFIDSQALRGKTFREGGGEG